MKRETHVSDFFPIGRADFVFGRVFVVGFGVLVFITIVVVVIFVGVGVLAAVTAAVVIRHFWMALLAG